MRLTFPNLPQFSFPLRFPCPVFLEVCIETLDLVIVCGPVPMGLPATDTGYGVLKLRKRCCISPEEANSQRSHVFRELALENTEGTGCLTRYQDPLSESKKVAD